MVKRIGWNLVDHIYITINQIIFVKSFILSNKHNPPCVLLQFSFGRLYTPLTELVIINDK